MRLYQTDFTYDHPWSTVTLAYFLRYPNPYARHVLASDVIDRYVDDEGCLHSTRLLLKRGKLPAWGAKILNINETYIIEDSVVDPKTMQMRTESKNLDHTRVLKVIESQTMTVLPSSDGQLEKTKVQTEVRTISKVPSFVGSKIEYLGVAKFRENFEKSKLGMQVVLEALNKRESPLATGARLGLGMGQRWRSVREWQARMNV